MDKDRIWLAPDVVNDLRARIVGVGCGCDGSGGVIEDRKIVDCKCMVDFKWAVKMLNSGIPKRYWDFDINKDLLKKFREKNEKSLKIINSYSKNIKDMVRDGIGLYIEGLGGTAKTAAAYWILKEALKVGVSCYALRMSQLSNLLRDTIDSKDFEDLILWLEEEVELLMVDEIEKDSKAADLNTMTGVWVNEFFNNFYNRKASLIVVSNVGIDKLDASQASNTVDRFKELVEVVMTGDSFRSSKSAEKLILSKKAL